MQKSTIREIGIICTCSVHGQPRYQIWIKWDKRQMTSCVQKMLGTDGRTDERTRVFQYTHHSVSGGITRIAYGTSCHVFHPIRTKWGIFVEILSYIIFPTKIVCNHWINHVISWSGKIKMWNFNKGRQMQMSNWWH